MKKIPATEGIISRLVAGHCGGEWKHTLDYLTNGSEGPIGIRPSPR
jgi:hypothetical protein